jgi:PHD/YefM family antitoxin component YafN of YafNO toxin-antitoxin module
MLYGAMPAVPVTDLRNKQAEVLAKLDETPILLTRGGHDAGVLVHPHTWNELIRSLQKFERAARLRKLSEEMDLDPSLSIPWEQVQQGLKERGLLNE